MFWKTTLKKSYFFLSCSSERYFSTKATAGGKTFPPAELLAHTLQNLQSYTCLRFCSMWLVYYPHFHPSVYFSVFFVGVWNQRFGVAFGSNAPNLVFRNPL